MAGRKHNSLIPQEMIENKIFLIRDKKVILDRDLAAFYNVPTKTLNQAVKRNSLRFPSDFMFRLTLSEALASRSQNVTLKRGQNIKYLPFAFTEYGVAMLSGVLNSDRAISVNIQIIRTFIKIKKLLSSHKALLARLDRLEIGHDQHSKQIVQIFRVIKTILDLPITLKRKSKKIGFVPPENELQTRVR